MHDRCVSRVTISGSRVLGPTYNESPGFWNSNPTFRVPGSISEMGLGSRVLGPVFRVPGPTSEIGLEFNLEF